MPARPALLSATILAALAAATGVAFAAWGEKGPAMFMVLAEGGLSWCF
ncbi:hypothetical protein [Aquibium microcysteis]|nr:hypothetical protein [Aquibium microcysteis]